MFLLLLSIHLKHAPRLEEQSSLFSPAVEEHGRSTRIYFGGDYVIKTFDPVSVYVQLGFQGINTHGSLGLAKALEAKDIRLDFKFQLTPSENPGDGVEFVLSKTEYNPEMKYGTNVQNDNIVVQISTTEKNPVLKLYARGNEQVFELKKNIYKGVCTLRLENIDNTLQGHMNIDDQEFKPLFTLPNSGIVKNMFYSVVTGNTRGYNIFKILGIRANTMDYISDSAIAERKSSKIVWIVFIGASIVIAYLVYNKQSKPQGLRS